MTVARKFRFAAYLSVASIVLSGCGGAKPLPPPPPTQADVTFLTSADVNADASGRANPIVVHVFELADHGKFQAADFFSLYESPDGTLGAELLKRQELQLVPGIEAKYAVTITNNAAYLGIVAGYRDLGGVNWRAVIALPPNLTTAARVSVGRRGLMLE